MEAIMTLYEFAGNNQNYITVGYNAELRTFILDVIAKDGNVLASYGDVEEEITLIDDLEKLVDEYGILRQEIIERLITDMVSASIISTDNLYTTSEEFI